MKTSEQTDRKLRERLLLSPRAESDRLMLADDVMSAAIGGSRALTEGERAALLASPLTLRRFRTLSAQLRRAAVPADEAWTGSRGMLRAAEGGGPLAALSTDDGCWTLHFVEQGGLWRVILALDAGAPFAVRMIGERPLLRVVDGEGAVILQGSLDADGECEAAWPLADPPGQHFQQHGAAFVVAPA